MPLVEIVAFFKDLERISTVQKGFEKLSMRAEKSVRSFSISKFSHHATARMRLTTFSRRDGSPFMNLLMVAPLIDSRGNKRYHIGAQVDVSGLCKECIDLPGLKRLLVKQEGQHNPGIGTDENRDQDKDTFQELSEMLNHTELDMVRRFGGKMHREQIDENEDAIKRPERPRLLIKDASESIHKSYNIPGGKSNGKLEGIFQNVSIINSNFLLTTKHDTVSPCPALSISPNSVLLARPSRPRHSSITVHVPHWRFFARA